MIGMPAGYPAGMPIFVVQRHDASRLHFDLRLEIDGVLVSWAVPKGPSLDPRDKRLAVFTEDHSLAYATFEGAIDGSYGAGTVIVWDTGEFENVTSTKGRPVPAGDALAGGHLRLLLHGHRLTGGFALTRTNMSGDDRNWILVKIDDDGADRRRRPATTELTSVLSGRTNADFENR
ncbi:MAG: ATP-dependent ligase clustered with Ku protein LigD [Nocardioides sp.]|nr:ATP-dependent ligase clustered with Ku protein LigD [Nocardioides sp.]